MKYCVVFCIITAFYLTACGEDSAGPSKNRLESAINAKLPPYWKVSKVDVIKEEERGDAVLTNLIMNFEAELRATQDLYTYKHGWSTNYAVVIKKSIKQGDKEPVSGTATARKVGTGWITEAVVDDADARSLGTPLENIEQKFKDPIFAKGYIEAEHYGSDVSEALEAARAHLHGTWRIEGDGQFELTLHRNGMYVLRVFGRNQDEAGFWWLEPGRGSYLLSLRYRYIGKYLNRESSSFKLGGLGMLKRMAILDLSEKKFVVSTTLPNPSRTKRLTGQRISDRAGHQGIAVPAECDHGVPRSVKCYKAVFFSAGARALMDIEYACYVTSSPKLVRLAQDRPFLHYGLSETESGPYPVTKDLYLVRVGETFSYRDETGNKRSVDCKKKN